MIFKNLNWSRSSLLKILWWLSIIFRIKFRLLYLALPTSFPSSAFSALLVYSPATWAFLFTHWVITFILFWGFGVAIPFLSFFFCHTSLQCWLFLIVLILGSPRGLSWVPKWKLPLSHVLYLLFYSHFNIQPCLTYYYLLPCCVTWTSHQIVKTMRIGTLSVLFKAAASVPRTVLHVRYSLNISWVTYGSEQGQICPCVQSLWFRARSANLFLESQLVNNLDL